jgi:ABC-type branched-subunit amino acid transport system permease subunit
VLNRCSPTTCRAAACWRAAAGLLLAWPARPSFPGVKALNVAAKVLVFIVLVASFDLLLGYTGIVSFAHTMFFGIGAYGMAIATTRWARPGGAGRGLGAALLVSLCCRWRWACSAARAGHLLCHDHAGRGGGLPDPGLAAV